MALNKKKSSADNIETLRDIAGDVSEADFVPFACHWNEHTVITKNGEPIQVIRLSDYMLQNVNHDGEDIRSRIRKALEEIDTTDYAVWVHTIRRKYSFQTGGEYKRDFAGYLDRFWRDRNDWEHKFVNEIYITVIKEGENASLANPVGFFRQILPRFDIRHREREIETSIEKLTGITDSMMNLLADYGAKKLGLYKENDIWYSEPCTFLSKLVGLKDKPCPVAQMSIDNLITDCDITFGYNVMEVRQQSDGGRRFGSYISIKEYREIPLESLDSVLKLPMEFIISQCFVYATTKEAIKDFEYQKKLFDVSNSQNLAMASGLKDIVESNRGKPTDFCNQQLGILLYADSVKTLDNNIATVITQFGVLGLAAIREDIMLEECFWSILPANFQFLRRLKPQNTSYMAGFASLSMFSTGKEKGNKWGNAVTTFNTVGRTPYYFNFHHGENGHTTIIGPEDTGKKVLLNFLVAQSRKYDGKLFYFDVNRLGEPFVRSLDGVYYNPCRSSDPRPYVSMAMNPLQLDANAENTAFLKSWLLLLLPDEKTDAQAKACQDALSDLLTRPKEDRHLALLADLAEQKQPGCKGALSPWIEGGAQAELFSNPNDALVLDGKVFGFEMANLQQRGGKAVAAVFSYLMHRILSTLDGKPGMVVLDEAWDILANLHDGSTLKSWLKQLTAKNAIMVLASEKVDQIMQSPVNAAIADSIATRIFLPDDAADPGYIESLGLPQKDLPFLHVMNTDDRQFLVVQGTESVLLELDLSGMVDIAAILSASSHHLKIMEQAIQARGISPSQWMPRFLENI